MLGAVEVVLDLRQMRGKGVVEEVVLGYQEGAEAEVDRRMEGVVEPGGVEEQEQTLRFASKMFGHGYKAPPAP